ncbi:hypothetical protein [Paracoccus yeei]|uniref:hypothetical protein n=1 Tax=Paracoccus yeei TaxID=147645 RepID=UPI003BF92479
MSNFNETPADRGADLEALEKQLSQALGKQKAPDPSQHRVKATLHSAFEVTLKDGKETAINRSKPLNGNTAYAVAPTRPGHVRIEGQEYPIKAAIAAGILPEGWTPEQGFEKPAEGKAGNLAGNQDAARGETDADAKDPGISPAMKASVAEAGKILDQVDQTHGSGVTDRYLHEIADTGEIPQEGLPEGVTPAQIEAVYAGYTAQCNAALADVGASVPMLEEMLDPDHLRMARQATVGQDRDTLKELGRMAQDRLARLPEKNPEAFADMIADMDPKERAALHQNPDNKAWTVRIPGHPEVSFAQAVKMGLVRF